MLPYGKVFVQGCVVSQHRRELGRKAGTDILAPVERILAWRELCGIAENLLLL